MIDNRTCKICDGGPGNHCACNCGMQLWEDPKPAPEPKIDFDSPEDVLIEVVCNVEDVDRRWQDHSIESCTVLTGENDDVMGAASYEQAYGGFLDYTIQDLIDCPGAGYFVVEGVTGTYTRGDGWMTDDDMHFAYKSVRPATAEERGMA